MSLLPVPYCSPRRGLNLILQGTVSSVAASSPSGGTGEGTKQASIRGKMCPTVISPGPAPVDKVDMGGAPSCRGRMRSEGTHCSAGNQLPRNVEAPGGKGLATLHFSAEALSIPLPSSSQLVPHPLPPAIQPHSPDQGLETILSSPAESKASLDPFYPKLSQDRVDGF